MPHDDDEHDLDLGPASDDDIVQQYLETTWRVAMSAARETAEQIQRIFPDLVHHLPETAGRQIELALADAVEAQKHLHRAGPHVLGQEIYDEYLAAQTRRQLSS